MHRLRNEVMSYAWGSREAIAAMQGRTPAAAPEAELWMGAHPKAPSLVENGGEWQPLPKLIAANPDKWMGPEVHAHWGTGLPFLFKVLAAETPLSLQAHPSIEQAQRGFDREQSLGIPIDAPHRNYRDRNHKPELICALTRFETLCGFRARDASAALFHELSLPQISSTVSPLWNATLNDEQAVRETFTKLMGLPRDAQRDLTRATLKALPSSASPFLSSYEWARRLGTLYPDDIGAVISLLLNQVTLQPGQALYLPAGNLHAYLQGVGVELMANSDNVLRGGCTPKHIDVAELVKVLSFRAGPIAVISPSPNDAAVQRYLTPAAEFELTRLRVNGSLRVAEALGPRILLVVEGGPVRVTAGTAELTLDAGESAYLEPTGEAVGIEGKATCFCAAVGAPHS